MVSTPIKTKQILPGDTLKSILDRFLPEIAERSIVVVTSKIVSICEGAIVKKDALTDKHALIRSQADQYLDDAAEEQYGITLTIKHHTLIASSGIDESNGNGYFILWPKRPFESAKTIWEYLRKKFHLKHVGVIITDSHTTPLRWGTTGLGIAWCGFEPLKNYIETPDIFGRTLRVTKASILDGLAASAVVTMGEGNEQTPLAVICDLPFVTFLSHPPSSHEIQSLEISLSQDIYAPLIDSPKWKKGGAA